MTQRVLLLALSAVVVATIVTVPASGANREHQQLMADIRMLQEQTLQLQAQLAGVTEALKSVATKLDDQTGATRKAFADQKLLVDSMTGDLRVIREKIDDNNVRMSSLSQEVEAVRLAIPQAMSQPSIPGEIPPGMAAAPPPQPGAALGQSPQKLFDAAWGDYTVGQYTLAIAGFTNYIKAFPTQEKAGEAQWYVGEAHFGLGNYKEAVAAYERVISDYPNHKLVPDAYYKRGVALNALGQVDRARESWEFVVKAYPSSDAGRLSSQKLELLIRKPPELT